MSQGQKQEQSQNGNKNVKPELDQDTIKAIISQKSQEVQLEFHRLKLEEKRLEQDGKLSEKAMDYNSKFVKDYPKQHRQTIITYGIFITLTFFGVLFFIGFCLYRGDAEVAKQFLAVVTHFITLVIGLFVGKNVQKKSNKEKQDGPEDAEILD
jgi:hypothetical protein